jgi:hypothetical protein
LSCTWGPGSNPSWFANQTNDIITTAPLSAGSTHLSCTWSPIAQARLFCKYQKCNKITAPLSPGSTRLSCTWGPGPGPGCPARH